MPGASAGAVRGALLAKLTLFPSATDFGLILRLPATLWGALQRSLGASLEILVAPGVALGIPRALLVEPWWTLRALLATRFAAL